MLLMKESVLSFEEKKHNLGSPTVANFAIFHKGFNYNCYFVTCKTRC